EIALDDAGDQLLIMQALETFQGPKMEVDDIELNNGNERRYVAGKVTYDELTLTVKDMVDQDVAGACLRWWTEVYNSSTASIGLAAKYKKAADLVLYGPNQEISRFWKLFGVYPKRFDHGDYDMNTSDKVL